MPVKHFSIPLITGILSGGLFLLVLGAGLGPPLLFIPTLPLFYSGLGQRARVALESGALAAALVLLVAGLPAALLYSLFFALPAWVMVRLGLRWHDHEIGEIWYPIGWIILRLSLYGCTLLALVTLYYSTTPGGLPQLLTTIIHSELAQLGDEWGGEIGEALEAAAQQWVFLIFPMSIWMWALALWAHAWLANWQLKRQHRALRPDFAVTPFPLPHWLLMLMGIAALAGLIGSDSLRFLGNGVLVVLLLPYFFLGVALVNVRSRSWPNQRITLGILYFLVALLQWPAFIFSAIGLWHHVKSLNKHLPSGGGPFRS